MGRVGIVCDSTCDLDPEYLASRDIVEVPLKVVFGDESFLDWIELRPEAFFKRLVSAPTLPKTSQPSPADFAAVYRHLVESGCDSIVSIHLTAALSGTVQSATLAASEAGVPVSVVDTKLVNQGITLGLKAAAAVRDAGGDFASVDATARSVAASTRMFFVLDTLDYLVKGGRAGKAQGLAASLLNIKPILTFNNEGTIEPHLKVKGFKKAITTLAEAAAKESEKNRLTVGLLHAVNPEGAAELKAALDAAGADYELDGIISVGAVIGTYAGPGAVGLAWTPQPDA